MGEKKSLTQRKTQTPKKSQKTPKKHHIMNCLSPSDTSIKKKKKKLFAHEI